MKKIKEASHEYFRAAQLGFENPGSEAGFKAGVEFAQRWISVEDELPEYHGIDFYVLMKNERLDSDDINLGLIEGIDDVENVYQYATHWRPIELK